MFVVRMIELVLKSQYVPCAVPGWREVIRGVSDQAIHHASGYTIIVQSTQMTVPWLQLRMMCTKTYLPDSFQNGVTADTIEVEQTCGEKRSVFRYDSIHESLYLKCAAAGWWSASKCSGTCIPSVYTLGMASTFWWQLMAGLLRFRVFLMCRP